MLFRWLYCFAILHFCRALCNNNLYSPHLYVLANKSIVQNSWHSLELWCLRGVQPKYNVINANKIIDWVFPFLSTFCLFLRLLEFACQRIVRVFGEFKDLIERWELCCNNCGIFFDCANSCKSLKDVLSLLQFVRRLWRDSDCFW